MPPDRFIGADAFDDPGTDAIFRCRIAPGGARCLSWVYCIDDDGNAETEIFVGHGPHDLVCAAALDSALSTPARHIAAAIVSIAKIEMDRARQRPPASAIFPEPGNPDGTISAGDTYLQPAMQTVIARGLWLAKIADPTTKMPTTRANSTIFTVICPLRDQVAFRLTVATSMRFASEVGGVAG